MKNKKKMKIKECTKENCRKELINARGITLIALVVTIIILLILASVAINLSIGDNGLFKKAEEAVNTYKASEHKESEDLRVLENELEKAKIDWSKVYNSTGYTPKNTPITTNEGTYYIPEGFKLADDSAGKISDGIVVEDKNGNQWVWIPCYVEENGEIVNREETIATSAVKFDRYAFSGEEWQYSQTKLDEKDADGSYKIVWKEQTDSFYFHEAIPTDQMNSVKEYGGFYIGRYEAGDSVSTSAKKMREEGDSEGNDISIKKNQVPYNWITIDNMKTLSAGIVTANEYNADKVFTVLCSSYAWDTALTFIGGDYAINSAEQGNYLDTTFKYTDITGSTQIKNKNTATLIPTGQRASVKNIYDMGGNLYERTTEYSRVSQEKIVHRGGECTVASNISVASHRSFTDYALSGNGGFRPTMFIKNDITNG